MSTLVSPLHTPNNSSNPSNATNGIARPNSSRLSAAQSRLTTTAGQSRLSTHRGTIGNNNNNVPRVSTVSNSYHNGSSNRESSSTIRVSVSRATFAEIITADFYKKDTWLDELCERLFKIQERETTIKHEMYFGMIHFISCFYCLAVIPQQMNKAGYATQATFVATALCSGAGSIILGLFANLPFVMAPPTVVAIFFSVFLQNTIGADNPIVQYVGSAGVVISGLFLLLMGYRPIGEFVGRVIPYSIQAGTAVGIGLLTALAGMTDVNFITTGSNGELLRMGMVTFEIGVAIAGVIIICLAQWYHVKGSFCIAIIICSLVYNMYSGSWPGGLFSHPHAAIYRLSDISNPHVPLLVADLFFLYILYLNGLISSLSYLAGLTREEGSVPRGRWVFLLSGIVTIASGILTGAPVLISPESAAAIKEGARTGLSSCVCGVLFLFSTIFSPIFKSIPDAGTAPILFMIGVLLFQNVMRVDWKNIQEATPAFTVLFFIPFSFSVIQGVVVGFIVYGIVGLVTGSLYENTAIMSHIYFPEWSKKVGLVDPRYDSKMQDDQYYDEDDDDFDLESRGDMELIDGKEGIAGSASAPAVAGTGNDRNEETNVGNQAADAKSSQDDKKSSRSRSRTRGRVDSTGDEYMSMGFEVDHLFEGEKKKKKSERRQQRAARKESSRTGAPTTAGSVESPVAAVQSDALARRAIDRSGSASGAVLTSIRRTSSRLGQSSTQAPQADPISLNHNSVLEDGDSASERASSRDSASTNTSMQSGSALSSSYQSETHRSSFFTIAADNKVEALISRADEFGIESNSFSIHDDT